MDSRQLATSPEKQECFPNLLELESVETECWWKKTGTWSESNSVFRLHIHPWWFFFLFSQSAWMMFMFVTMSNSNMTSTLTFSFLHLLCHYEPSEGADRQNTHIIWSLWAFWGCFKFYKSSRVSAEATQFIKRLKKKLLDNKGPLHSYLNYLK